jgi:hypothetical protein
MKVRTCGTNPLRCREVTPRTRIFPVWRCGSISVSGLITAGIWPPSKSWMAGAEPRNGMYCSRTPLADPSRNARKWVMFPAAGVPMFVLAALVLIHAT